MAENIQFLAIVVFIAILFLAFYLSNLQNKKRPEAKKVLTSTDKRAARNAAVLAKVLKNKAIKKKVLYSDKFLK